MKLKTERSQFTLNHFFRRVTNEGKRFTDSMHATIWLSFKWCVELNLSWCKGQKLNSPVSHTHTHTLTVRLNADAAPEQKQINIINSLLKSLSFVWFEMHVCRYYVVEMMKMIS